MREFDFDSVGKRLPYSVPEGFIERAKVQAVDVAMVGVHPRRQMLPRVVMAAAAVVVAVCGTALWLVERNSPERRYERLLAQTSTEVLWEYACEYDVDTESDMFY